MFVLLLWCGDFACGLVYRLVVVLDFVGRGCLDCVFAFWFGGLLCCCLVDLICVWLSYALLLDVGRGLVV